MKCHRCGNVYPIISTVNGLFTCEWCLPEKCRPQPTYAPDLSDIIGLSTVEYQRLKAEADSLRLIAESHKEAAMIYAEAMAVALRGGVFPHKDYVHARIKGLTDKAKQALGEK